MFYKLFLLLLRNLRFKYFFTILPNCGFVKNTRELIQKFKLKRVITFIYL